MKMRAFYFIALVVVMLLQAANVKSNGTLSSESYNILMLLPLSSQSHRTLFLTLAETLAERGHKIELLVNHPPISNNPNIREIYHGLPHFQEDKFQLFSARDHPWEIFSLVMEGAPLMTRDLYELPEVMALYERRKEFHLVMVDNFYNQMMFPFAHETPLAMLVASGMDPIQSAIMGNVINPSYVPNREVMLLQPMGFWQRMINVAMHFMAGFIKHYVILPKIQAEISSIFPDVPALEEIERNQSLVLLNYCPSFDVTIPLLPLQVDVGCLHCRPGRSLSEDLEDWITGAGESGVIYFSLGTVAQGITLPDHWRDTFVKVFSRLEERVVWKYEGEIPGVSDNVLIRKWLPQQDVLAHQNVKLFISHAGMLSTQEAVYHATPVLAIPIFADQPRNAHLLHVAKLGISVNWEDLTEDYLLDMIKNISESEVYIQNIKSASKILRDHPVPPRDRAAFWTEYVIRHKGAHHLRSPSSSLSWVQFLLLDVAVCCTVIFSIVFITLYLIISSIFRRTRSNANRKNVKHSSRRSKRKVAKCKQK
ncbi:UDP-glycosyltransferase UGT5-like [Palaemon carinicauda]|uniref:UDP-glycosyltransferase UGT5-like n=1 Tax=Palaemon carinicauda TaxID=392227 RepID=UPI0035B5D92C